MAITVTIEEAQARSQAASEPKSGTLRTHHGANGTSLPPLADRPTGTAGEMGSSKAYSRTSENNRPPQGHSDHATYAEYSLV